MQSCKGVCEPLKHRPSKRGGVWNEVDICYCSICTIYQITKELHCKCCGTLLRKNPHSKQSKARRKNNV
jgi:hypothetical protein